MKEQEYDSRRKLDRPHFSFHRRQIGRSVCLTEVKLGIEYTCNIYYKYINPVW